MMGLSVPVPLPEFVMWCIALPSSLLGVVVTILTLLGLGEDADFDAAGDVEVDADLDTDADVDGGVGVAHYFSIKNVILFFMGFSWTGIILLRMGWGVLLTSLAALVVGLVLSLSFMKIFQWITGLSESGNLSETAYLGTIGKTGKVYLTIPGARAGRGKIQIPVEGRLMETAALTDGETLPPGTPVRVLDVDDDVLWVERV